MSPDKIRVVAEMNAQARREQVMRSLSAWSQPCPKCGAVPGDSCEMRDGEDYGRRYVHAGRRQ